MKYIELTMLTPDSSGNRSVWLNKDLICAVCPQAETLRYLDGSPTKYSAISTPFQTFKVIETPAQIFRLIQQVES